MSLVYDEVIRNLHQVKFAGTDDRLLDDYFHETAKPTFVEEHKIFYPQGIFTENGLNNFYFFTETKLARVSFAETIDTQVWRYSEVSSYKLIMPNFYDLKLLIYLETGDVLQFDSEDDTNIHRKGTLKKKIQEIFNLLEDIN